MFLFDDVRRLLVVTDTMKYQIHELIWSITNRVKSRVYLYTIYDIILAKADLFRYLFLASFSSEYFTGR